MLHRRQQGRDSCVRRDGGGKRRRRPSIRQSSAPERSERPWCLPLRNKQPGLLVEVDSDRISVMGHSRHGSTTPVSRKSRRTDLSARVGLPSGMIPPDHQSHKHSAGVSRRRAPCSDACFRLCHLISFGGDGRLQPWPPKSTGMAPGARRRNCRRRTRAPPQASERPLSRLRGRGDNIAQAGPLALSATATNSFRDTPPRMP